MNNTPDLSTPEGRCKDYAEIDAFHERRMREYKPTDSIDKLCHQAAVNSTQWAKDDGLHPVREDFGEFRYRVQQGLRAAAVGREDSASTLQLMRPTLYFLHRIERALWVVIAMLVVIVWRVW